MERSHAFRALVEAIALHGVHGAIIHAPLGVFRGRFTLIGAMWQPSGDLRRYVALFQPYRFLRAKVLHAASLGRRSGFRLRPPPRACKARLWLETAFVVGGV